MKTRRVGLLGAGNIAAALIEGLLASGTLDVAQLRASDVSRQRLKELSDKHGITTCPGNDELVQWADVIVLAVKPQVLAGVLDEIEQLVGPQQLVISVAAGVPIEAIESRLPPQSRVVRVMPNTAAVVLAAATAVAAGTHATSEDLQVARTLFDAVGRAVVLDESAMNAVTGLSGSGPAYVMLIIEALADGGVRMGLPRQTALLLAAQTVHGAAKLLLDTGEHPGKLKDQVTSPGGTTITGVHQLEKGGLRRTLMDAVQAATERAAELGRATADKLRR